MPTEPIQFDMNGDPIQPTRPSPARTLMDELGAWSPIATVMMNATMATPHTPAITGICYMGGVLNIQVGGSNSWQPVAHVNVGQHTFGHPQHIARLERQQEINRGRPILTLEEQEYADRQALLERDRLEAERRATNPAWADPRIATTGATVPLVQTRPANLTDLPPPPVEDWRHGITLHPSSVRSGRTAAERAAAAAAAEHRRNERRSDPPHDTPYGATDGLLTSAVTAAAASDVTFDYVSPIRTAVVTSTEAPF